MRAFGSVRFGAAPKRKFVAVSRIDRSSRVTPATPKLTQLATCQEAPASTSNRLVRGAVHVPFTTPEGDQSQPRSDSMALAPVNGPVVHRHDFWMSPKKPNWFLAVACHVVLSEWFRYQSKLAAGRLVSGSNAMVGVPGTPDLP